MTPTEQHAHLVAESQRVGWPVAYKTDLGHDLTFLREYPTPVFGWCLRETGTELFLPVDTLVTYGFGPTRGPLRQWCIDGLRYWGKDPKSKLYWFDGRSLRPVSLAALLEKLTEENKL